MTELLDRGGLRFPALPEAVTRLLSEARRDDADARKLAEIVRRDAALAAHVLRVAASGHYSRGAPIKSLVQAVTRLGRDELRQIALVVGSKATAFRVPGHAPLVRELFRHAFATALFAQEVARRRRSGVEEAFLAGLFHDVGKPVILAALVELRCPIDSDALAVVEELHPAVGGALLAAWSLSPAAQAAARHHHDEAPPAEAKFANVVALADALAHATFDGGPAPGGHRALAALELYPEDIQALLAHGDAITRAVAEVA